MTPVNRAAARLSRKYPKEDRGARAALAREVDVDEGYLSRILSGERTPGAAVRKRFWRVKRTPMHWWDETPAGKPIADPNHATKPAA